MTEQRQWSDVYEKIGAGPILERSGRISLVPMGCMRVLVLASLYEEIVIGAGKTARYLYIRRAGQGLIMEHARQWAAAEQEWRKECQS